MGEGRPAEVFGQGNHVVALCRNRVPADLAQREATAVQAAKVVMTSGHLEAAAER